MMLRQIADVICWCVVLKFSLRCGSQLYVMDANYATLCQRQHAQNDLPGSWQVNGMLK